MVVMRVTFRRERERERASFCLLLISYGRFLYTGSEFEWREGGFSFFLSGEFTKMPLWSVYCFWTTALFWSSGSLRGQYFEEEERPKFLMTWAWIKHDCGMNRKAWILICFSPSGLKFESVVVVQLVGALLNLFIIFLLCESISFLESALLNLD